jgi:hypothetical protein
MMIPHKYYHQHDFQEDIMATITCGSCNKSHSTVNEVKLCFTQNNNFVAETTKAPAKVVKKAAAPEAKGYTGIKTFETREEAEEFVQNTPNSKLKKDCKVKESRVWDEQTESYKTVKVKTYTVVIY